MFKNVKNNLRGQKITLALVITTLKTHGPLALLKKASSYTSRIALLVSPQSVRRLFFKRLSRFSSDDVDAVIDYGFNVLGGLIRPVQIRSEFKSFLLLFQEKKPQVILEIGVDKGGSLFSFCKLAPEDSLIIAIDLPEEDGGYSQWKEAMYMKFKKPKQELILLRGDSHSEETLHKIKDILAGREIDFAFIDGDHSYEGVKQDFDMYSPLIKKGGLVSFHDVATYKAPTGVPQLWEEIKKTHETVEFIEDQQQVGFGIGCATV